MTKPSEESSKTLRARQTQLRNKAREPSAVEKAAALTVRKGAAKAILERRSVRGPITYEMALSELFSTPQLKLLNQWCKKHGVDRRVAISEIIEAGMKAKGIAC